jgi:Sulfatase
MQLTIESNLPLMVLALTLVAVIGAVALTERSVKQLPFAIAALFLNAALLLIFVGDVERAILLAGIIALAIAGASMVKFDHSALKLTVSDVPLAFAGTAPFLVAQYPRMMLGILLGSVSLVAASLAVLLTAAGPPIALDVRAILLSFALIGFATVAAKRASLRRSLTDRRCFYSTFVASLIDPMSWQQFCNLAMSDIADEPLPLKRAIPARATPFPDIIVIQHESIFDPRIFGLPVEPSVEAFLSPAEGRHGSLNVDIFGGGSWQSEFSLLTGLSSASFGSSAYYLFKKGAGRFHTSLPFSLSSLGYQTTLISSCRRNFLHYDEFYRSIGIDERIFTDDLPPPFDVGRFEATNSDALFLEAAVDAHARRVADDPTPRFLYLLTSYNHGPHDRRLGQFEQARAFAMANCGDAGYAEYYARLAETASIWQRLKAELALSGRPTLIVHYGDHQPVLTQRLDYQFAGDTRRAFRTFYAIEGLNVPAERFGSGRVADLDIALLGTVTLQAAGLPLDPIFSTRASLLGECGAGYFASASLRKRQFHRTLVDLGLIDLGPGAQPARTPKPDITGLTRTRPTH